MTEKTSIEQRIEMAGGTAAADARRRGLDEAHQREAAREAEELAADPVLNRAINDLEAREAQERAEERRAAIQRQNLQERKYREDLDKHYQDRLNFYRLKGVPEAAFRTELWPELRSKFVAGEEDSVDRERREKSGPVF